MVAMNSVICGWLTSGRSTTRSIAMPSSDHHRQRDHQREPEVQPRSTSETKVSAAKNTIAPCAKLNTPEAL